MKFRKFGKTVLTAALASAIAFSLSSCVTSFTSGYIYVTGTVTATPTGNGIISGFKIDNNTGKLTTMHGLPVSSGGANPVRAVLLAGGRFVYVLNQGTPTNGKFPCNANNPCLNSNVTEFVVGGNGVLTAQGTFYTQGSNPIRMVSDTSGNYLYILDHDAPSGQYCGTIVTGATECGDITVFKVDGTTGRLSLVSNAQLTASSGSSVTYFPLPADPIDLVLTRAAAHASPVANATSLTVARAIADTRHWWVQVGEFRSRDAARQQIEAVSHRFARLFDNAEGSVDGSGKAYRAVFNGLSEQAAREACSTVKDHGVPCITGGRA